MALIDELLAQAQRDLSAREVQIVSELLKSYGVALSRIERELRTIDAQIAELIASGDDIDDRYIQRQRWWREVEESIQQQMARWSGDAATGIATLQRGGVQIAVDVAGQIAKEAGSPFKGRVYAEAFERWVSAIQPGAPVRQVIDGYGDKVTDAVLQRMTEGIGGGKAPRSIVREIMRDVGGIADEARIMTLALNESMRAYRGASSDTMGKLQARGIVTGYVWLAALDQRTCIACISRHGRFYPEYPTDFHVRCRCVARPVANPDLVPGGGWKGKTGAQWFAEQPEKVQRKMLVTDARFDAYRQGVSLSDMTTVRSHPIWGDAVAIRPSRDLANAPRREAHPLNSLVWRGEDGIWGSDELPVMTWELPEARVVLPPDLQERLQFASPVLRWSAEKYQVVLTTHRRDAHVIQSLSEQLTGWRYVGREGANPAMRRLLLQDESGRWYAITLGELFGSENVVTVVGSRRANFLANRLNGLIDVIERGEE